MCSLCFGQVTWQLPSGPYGGPIIDLAYHQGSGKIFTILPSGLFVSKDNATSWQILSLEENNDLIRDIEIEVNGNIYLISENYLFISTDSGVTFTKKSHQSVYMAVIRVKKSPTNGTFFILGASGQSTIFRSTDGGETWTSGHSFGYDIYDIAISNNGNIYVIGSRGLEKSTDDGINFSVICSDATSMAINSSGTKVYCVTSTGIYESPQGPVSWTPIQASQSVMDVSFSGSIFFTPQTNKIFFNDQKNHKFFTSDYVETLWTPNWAATVPSGFISLSGYQGINVISAAVIDANTIIFGTDLAGVVKTENGGSITAESNHGLGANLFSDFVIAQNGNIIAASGFYPDQRSSLFTSVDGGKSWIRDNIGRDIYTTINSLFKLSAAEIIAFGGYIALRSNDNGLTWSTNGITTPTTPNLGTYKSPDGIKIFRYGRSELYFSGDSGASWGEAISILGLPYKFGIVHFIADLNNNVLLSGYSLNETGPDTYGVYSLAFDSKLNPSSARATLVSPPGIKYVDDMTTSNGKIFVLGKNSATSVVDVTADGGSTWTSATLLNQGTRISVDDQYGYVFVMTSVGTNTNIDVSRDGGLTFSKSMVIPNTKPGRTIPRINTDANGYAYALSDFQGLFKTTNKLGFPLSLTAKWPASNSMDALVTTSLELIFDDGVVPVAEKNIYLYKHVNDSLLVSIPTTSGVMSSTITFATLNNKISFSTGLTLNSLTKYYVKIDSGAFIDLYHSVNPAINWSFTTCIVTGDIALLPNPISLFPNPSHDYVFIKGISELVTKSLVFDMIGLANTIELNTQGDILIGDIRNLPKGIYILKLTTSNTNNQIRFIKY